MTAAVERIGTREKIAYGFGDFASSMFWKMIAMYLLVFYTDVFGISAAAVGTMFLITRIWDTVNDPVMGIIADRTTTRWGKFRPYLLWGAIPFALIGILTFTTPDLSTTGKLVYAYVTYTMLMMIYTVLNVPYASLLGVITSNLNDRSTLATSRMVLAFVGSFVVVGTAEPLAEFFSRTDEGENPQRGWQLTMMVFSCLAAVLFFLNFAWTKERIAPPKAQQKSLTADLKNLAQNKQWFILLAAGVSSLIFNSIRDGSAIFYFKYFYSNQSAFQLPVLDVSVNFSTLYLMVGQGAAIIGVLLAKPAADLLGKKNTFLGAMILCTIFSCVLYIFSEEQVMMLFVFQFLISICAASIFPLLWSMYADIADYSEWETGRRATGLIFSSSSMSQKFGWTIGGAVTGWMLAFYGFEANVEQTEEAKNGIRLMISVIPAVGALLSGIFILFYKLSDSFVKQINEELNERRAKEMRDERADES